MSCCDTPSDLIRNEIKLAAQWGREMRLISKLHHQKRLLQTRDNPLKISPKGRDDVICRALRHKVRYGRPRSCGGRTREPKCQRGLFDKSLVTCETAMAPQLLVRWPLSFLLIIFYIRPILINIFEPNF